MAVSNDIQMPLAAVNGMVAGGGVRGEREKGEKEGKEK